MEDNGPIKRNNNRAWIKWALREYDIDVSTFSSSFIERISCNLQSDYETLRETGFLVLPNGQRKISYNRVAGTLLARTDMILF